jgi:hypothetical protein
MSRARVGSGGMDSDIWLPLATLVLGWAGAQVTEMLRDRRTTTRERLARRAELQRTTLLELQDALAKLWRGVLASMTLELAMLKEEEQEQARWKPTADASRGVAITRGRIKLLASRVEDERVRELSITVANASRDISMEDAWRPPEEAISLRDLEASYSAAVARIGELLRERY